MGPNNGVSFGLSEAGTQLVNDPDALAVWYASTMGEFMKNGVAYFSPWTWDPGMWETLHLFSRYNKNISVQAVSSDEQYVSAYTTTDSNTDSVTIALVNRSTTQTETVTVNFPDFQLRGNPISTLTLSNLPATETFVSQTDNALQASSVTPTDNTLQLTMAPMSITSLLLTGTPPVLPLNLLSFTATKDNDEVLLNFTTAGAVNLASFDIERSADSTNFTSIGTVPATDSAQDHYQFWDTNPLSSVDYYRLKMINSDGSYSFSRILAVHFDNPTSLSLFPNPASGSVNIELNFPEGPILLRMVDVLGRLVRTQSLQSNGSLLSTTIDVTGLAPGVYFIKAGGETLSLFVDRRN
jgi:Secretion system C-terminal sorting domain